MKVRPILKRSGPPTCANCGQGREQHRYVGAAMPSCGNWKSMQAKLAPVGAAIEVGDGEDAVFLAHLLSYARDASFDSTHDGKKVTRMLQQLAGALEALNFDANCYLEKRTGVYHQTRKLFDPDWSEA